MLRRCQQITLFVLSLKLPDTYARSRRMSKGLPLIYLVLSAIFNSLTANQTQHTRLGRFLASVQFLRALLIPQLI